MKHLVKRNQVKPSVKTRLISSLFLLLAVLCTFALPVTPALAAPAILDITWDEPVASEANLIRTQADAGAWTFNIRLASNLVIVSGPNWNYSNGSGGSATNWGSWNTGTGGELNWSSPTSGGIFTVSVSGRIRRKGNGGGGNGPVEEKDFSASWSGKVEGPYTPPEKPCPPGDPDFTDGCPEGGIDETSLDMFVATSPLISSSAQGEGVRFSLVHNTRTQTFGLSADCHIRINPDGSITVIQPNDCETTFTPDSNGTSFSGGAGDYRFVTIEDGVYYLHVPGSDKRYKFTPSENGLNLMMQDGLMEGGEGEVGLMTTPGNPSGPTYALTEVEDAHGNTVTYTRDENGRITSATDAAGNTTTITYDSNGRISEIEDAFGRTVSYTYDTNGRLSSQTDVLGQTTSYTYDSQDRIVTIEGPLGTTTYTYEGGAPEGDGGMTGYSAPGQPMGFAKRTTVEHPDGSKEEYFYDGNGNYWHVAPKDYVEYVDGTTNNASEDVPKTKWKVETIAGQARTTEVTSPSGAKTSYEFDGDTGQLIGSTGPLDNDSSVTYNDKGNPLTMTGPDGKTLTLVYAANGEDVIEVKDPQNNVVASYTYNDKHQVLTATDALDNTTTNTYTSWGELATVTDANGKTTTYYYDSTSKLLTSVSHDGHTLASYTYDSRERVRTATDATGMTVTYDYDAADRVIKVTYPDETFEETSYAVCCGIVGEKPASVKDRSGRWTEYEYDAMGRVIKVTDAADNEVEYAYDASGNMTQLKDTKGNLTRFEYNVDGLVSKKIYADDTYDLFTYDDAGQLVGRRDGKGNVVNYEYDDAGRVLKIDYPTLPDVTYTYDALGRVATSTDSLGTSSYTYDTLGQVTSIDGPWDDDTISYSYDVLGRQTSLSINGSTQASYAYDALDRLTGVTSGTNSFGYSYNGASSQLTQLTLPGGSTTEYAYDGMQRLTQVQSKTDADANIANFEYGYNNRDVRTSVEKTLGTGSTQTVNYTYDTIDQLTKELSAETTPLLDKEYSYDAMGNRISSSASGTSTSYTTNNLNQVTQTSVNSVNTSITYDLNGNTIAVGAKQFNYDEADRLTGVVVPGEKKSEFVYDAEGRKRISKEYTWDAAANGGAGGWEQSDETRFIYDGMDLVQERAANGDVKASYVRDGNIGGVLSMTNGDGTFYYHYDGNGNVAALTDASQNIVAQYSYDAFGNLLSSSGAQADKNPFRFSSKYYDGDTGLYDYGFRHYDSSMGRWLNRDPIAEDGGINLYGFISNSPTNSIDEYGLYDPVGMSDGLGGAYYGKPSGSASSEKIPTFDARTERLLKTLHPKARVVARKSLAAIRAAGIDARIISGSRTYAEQDALYAQGRTKPGRIVTNARGGYSNHNFGIAWDIGIFKDGKYLPESPLYAKAGKIGKGKGCEWGGDWEFQDQPHFEYPTGISMAEKRRRVREGLDIITGR